jgi:hypothetical protein
MDGIRRPQQKESNDMKKRNRVAVRAIGVATSAVVVVSMASAGRAAAAPSYAPTVGPNAEIVNNTLVITGTPFDDHITLNPGADATHVVVDLDGNVATFETTTFTQVAVELGNGNDAFTEAPGILINEQLTLSAGRGDDQIQTEDTIDIVFGEGGNDTISTGKGVDLVFGGTGDDFVDGGTGNDAAFLDQGHDVFQWDPGEGSDFIDGGEGHSDVMLFNGAGANETASLSANGHRSVFLRDPGTVRMDMDNVEDVEFNALGGTDNITVNDLRGTDIDRFDVNLGVGGGPDSVLDNVTVNGTDDADHIRISGDGSSVNVAGLHATTTITGADVRDQLHVNGGDGNDKITTDATATALIGVSTDLGAGQH